MNARNGQGRRAQRARHDGLLLLDKPQGLSSNAALMRARRVFGGAKGGHGGTLDPMATGLLPLLFGEATKFAHGLLEADKCYRAELVLGQRTDTGDAEGRPIDDRRELVDAIEPGALELALSGFRGEIDQVPPMYSALKRDGRPLYAYAREGVTLERAARRVRIHRIELLEVQRERVALRVSCSKGTYIRTLAEDIGEALGCGAHLGALRREQTGMLLLRDAIGLDELESLGEPDAAQRLAPIDSLIDHLQRLDLSACDADRLRQGQRIRLAAPPGEADRGPAQLRVYDASGHLIGVARIDDGLLSPVRLVATQTPANDDNKDEGAVSGASAPSISSTPSSRNPSP